MPSILRNSSRFRRDQRQPPEEEEMWFNEEDDFEDVAADKISPDLDNSISKLNIFLVLFRAPNQVVLAERALRSLVNLKSLKSYSIVKFSGKIIEKKSELINGPTKIHHHHHHNVGSPQQQQQQQNTTHTIVNSPNNNSNVSNNSRKSSETVTSSNDEESSSQVDNNVAHSLSESTETSGSKTLADLLDEESVSNDEEEQTSDEGQLLNQQLADTSCNEDNTSNDNVDVNMSCKDNLESDRNKKAEPEADIGVTKVS